MKGHLFWTKVSMTEHQTSRSLPKVWPWASSTLLDTPAGETPCWGLAKSRLPCAAPPSLFLFQSSWGNFPSQYRTNSSLPTLASQWFQLWGCSQLPPWELRLSPGLIWVCIMLHWRRPVWFWHLVFFFPHLSIPASARGSNPRGEILCGWQRSSTT
jgi:hypothetical protein